MVIQLSDQQVRHFEGHVVSVEIDQLPSRLYMSMPLHTADELRTYVEGATRSGGALGNISCIPTCPCFNASH